MIEKSRFSYQQGLDNDRFGKTTILLSPGEHIVDNRPGWIPINGTTYRLRNGTTSSDFSPFNSTSNFDLTSPTNDLYKLNSVHGGVIVPRGVSIVGQDLRKTTIRPLYVPNPENDNIENSQFSELLVDVTFSSLPFLTVIPTEMSTETIPMEDVVPNFSHHKLTCFEYADGVNNVVINDTFTTNFQGYRTDLDMYYEKVGLAMVQHLVEILNQIILNRGLDIQPKIDEFRIVGPTGGGTEISTIIAGDGTTLGKTDDYYSHSHDNYRVLTLIQPSRLEVSVILTTMVLSL